MSTAGKPAMAWTARGLAGVALLLAFTVGLSGSLGADSPTVRTGLLAQARAGHTATLLPDGRVLFTGGRSRQDTLLATAELWDPSTRTSTVLAGQLTTPRVQHAASLLPTAEVLLTAGRDAVGVLRQAELFHLPGPGRALPDSLQIARAGHTSTLLSDGRVLILGGRDVSQVGLAEGEAFEVDTGLLYDPQHGRFTLLPHLLQGPRHNHTATLLPDGRLLVVGGKQGEAFLGSLEVVDPVEGTSTLLEAQLHRARARHGAVLLNDGRVVVAGGRHGERVLDTAEVIDLSTGTVTLLDARLRRPRVEFTATTLATGEILLAGGRTEDDDPRRDWELYGPPPSDLTPPTVLAVSPADQATAVTRTPLLALRFSEPIKVTTFTPTQVRLTDAGGQAVPGTVTPAEEGLLGFVFPGAPLAPGTTYMLTLQGATDRAGNPLAPVTSRFTTVGASPTITGFSPSSGTVGATVFLTGEHFDSVPANNQVKFNGVAAVVTVATATGLTTSVPAGATTGKITVTTPGGSATSNSNFIVITGPAITSFTPTSGPAGTSVMISGQNFDGTTAANNQVQFNGKPAIITSASATTITTTVPQGATTGPVTVTTAQGTGTSATNFTVTGPDFAISALPTPLTVPAIGQGGVAVSLTGTGGVTTLATLSVTGVPAGMTATFSAATLTMGQSAFLTVTTNGTTTAGLYPLTIQAVGLAGGVQTTRSVTTTVQVLGAGTTTLSGQVRDEDAKPVKGALIKLGALQVSTDDGGNFLLQNPPAGMDQLLLIDGTPASTPSKSLPVIPLKVTIVAGAANALSYIPHLHFQKTTGLVDISNASVERLVTDPELPGFEMKIPAGATIIGWDGQPNTQISVRRVPVDRIPLPPPPSGIVTGAVYMDYFGKPGGGTPSEPIPVTLPNDLDLPPGTQVELWYFDEAPDGSRPNQWAQYGTGTVSADGSQIIPDINPATGKPFGQPRFCCGASLAGLIQARFNSVFDAPATGQGGDKASDPVDLATGLFTLEKTDMVLPGRMPIALTRTYRTQGFTTGPFGRGTAHPYHMLLGRQANQRIVRLPDGRRFVFTLQPDNTFRNLTDASLQGAVLTEPSGVSTLRWRDGTVWTFGLSSTLAINTFELTQMDDRNGNTITLTRSGNLITAITASDGRALTLEYEGGRVARVHDPLGRTVTYAYEGAGNLATVTDPEHGVTRYTYDSANRMTTLTDARGLLFLQNVYGPSGRVLRQVQADGSEWRLRYELTGATVTGPCTVPTGNVVTVTLPVVTCPTEDSWENLQAGFTITGGTVMATTVIDPRGSATTTRFNARGYRIGQTDGLSQTTASQRTAANQVSVSTDSLGRTTSFEYDTNGNVTKITDPEGHVTRFDYDPTFNRVTKITDALDQVTEFTYDASGNLLTTKDPLNQVTTITYNSFGQPTSVQGPIPTEPPTTFEYDANGNLVTTTDPLGNQTQRTYDAASRLTSLQDPRGLFTQFRYDQLNRVTEIADARNGLTRFTYDPNGNLLSVQDAKDQVTTYTYDPMDRLATRTDALNRQESYQYDPAGNLSQFTDRKGKTRTFTYDGLNRKTGASFEDGSTFSFTYDAGARRVAAQDSNSGRIDFAFDNLDRLVQTITPQGTLMYNYDALGRRTSMVINGGPPVIYTYDAASRLTQVAQGAQNVAIGYDAVGRRTTVAYPNGVTTSYTYDQASRLVSVLHQGPAGVIESLTYNYDAGGNRMSTSRVAGTATSLPATAQFTYDQTNQQIQVNTTTLSYDANGNLISDGAFTYTWDSRDQLVGIIGPGVSANFSYDVRGRRISKTINGVRSDYLYDGDDIIGEVTGGALQSAYLRSRDVDDHFARLSANNEYYHTDALGSTLALSNVIGTTTSTYSYEPFGRTSMTGASSNSFQFTGRENDGTGLFYYRNRYYSPVLGRFISDDPMGFSAGDLNLYAYVGNAPTVFDDPYGLWSAWHHEQLTAEVAIACGLPYRDARAAASASFNQDVLHPQSWFDPSDPKHYMPGTETEAERYIAGQFKQAVNSDRAGYRQGAMRALGRGLHAVQDAWAHAKNDPPGTIENHRRGGSEPDNPRRHPYEYERAKEATKQYIIDFMKHRGLKPKCE